MSAVVIACLMVQELLCGVRLALVELRQCIPDYCVTSCVWVSLQAGDDSAEMHQRLKDLGVPIPTGPDAAPSLPAAPMPMGNIIPAPGGPMMGMGQPYPLMPQITVGPTEFLSVNGMVTPDVLVDDEEYREV